MSVKLECIGCREIKDFDMPEPYPVCDSCKEWERKHLESLNKETEHQAKKSEKRVCSICGYSGSAIDKHHIHGRKVSKETVLLCANCHREVHAGIIKL